MKTIRNQTYTGERPLYHSSCLKIENTIFGEGESPLKESSNINLSNCIFQWKYPFWYCHDIQADNSTWLEMARAGVWYSDRVTLDGCMIDAPKNFRRCTDLVIRNTVMTRAQETLWNCSGVRLENVQAHGDYFGMNCQDLDIDNLQLSGNYSFDGVRNMKISNSRLISKDAFWNCENVTVENCQVFGEYIGWNSKNLTFINCTIESLQGFCYIENLKLVNCTLLNTTLAFEKSSVNIDVRGRIDSVFNPISGVIEADSIGEIILDSEQVNTDQITIRVKGPEA